MEQELKEKIKNSGNNLHLDVAYFLKNKGWDTNLSLYYCDDITKTPREIDIKATKTFKMVYDDDDKYKFDAHLFIECKNFSKEFAFRLLDNNFETSKLVLISQNHNIFSSGDNLRNTDLPNKHHYFLENKIGCLWDSLKEQEKDIFDAVTQPIKSLIFFEKLIERRSIFYPVVICKGIEGFYGVDEVEPVKIDEYLDGLKPAPKLTFGLKYASSGRMSGGTEMSPISRNFYIDFVLRDHLNSYLVVLEKEIEEVGKYLLRKLRL